MTMVLRFVKKVYRALFPERVRNSRVIRRMKQLMVEHDWIYDAEYYETVEGPALRSAATIAGSIVSEFEPESVIDVGCGTGALLEALRTRGCRVYGLEYAQTALTYCRARGLEVSRFDIERHPLEAVQQYDVAVSLEVAEHLPPRVADRYIELLTRAAPVVVFSAAPPGQGGTDHVNEQPPSYWIEKFRRRGFEFAEETSYRWRRHWVDAGDVETWYHQNLMVFRQSQPAP